MGLVDAAYLALIERAADRAGQRGGYIASRFSAAEVIAALGCDRLTAARVRLCRLPRAESFSADVAEIATYAGVDAEQLAALLPGCRVSDAGAE